MKKTITLIVLIAGSFLSVAQNKPKWRDTSISSHQKGLYLSKAQGFRYNPTLTFSMLSEHGLNY